MWWHCEIDLYQLKLIDLMFSSLFSSIPTFFPPLFPQDRWRGGCKDKDGHDVTHLLSLNFDQCVLQCLLREAHYLFLWLMEHATVWREKEEA